MTMFAVAVAGLRGNVGRELAGATVLVVDDHPSNRLLLERILTKAGVPRVLAAGDPQAAVELYRTARPDLVMLDLHMPGMDGVAVMHAFDALTTDDDFVPVIVLTADSTPDARQRALAAGASDFLTKPFDQIEVVLRAGNLLHNRAMHVRLQDHNTRLEAEVAERRQAEERQLAVRAEKHERITHLLASGGPRMVFQPIVDLVGRNAVGFEALARFDGDLARTPDVWFADAADVALGERLELAAAGAALHRLDQLSPGSMLSINLSPDTLGSAHLTELLRHVPPERVVFEITEHRRIDDYDLLRAQLAAHRRSGVRLAIDDAGAGFASLRHILWLEPDIIKLDIALTRDIDTDPIKRALAASLVTFSDELGATIIAEGIETASELETLVELGVPWGQGYLLGRPAPIEDLATS